MDKLNSLRNSIDSIDKQLVQLFEERINIVKKIGDYKKENEVPIENKNREEYVIDKNSKYLKDKTLESYLKEFLQKIMDISKDVQKDDLLKLKEDNKIKVGFQGQKGSFSEAALNKYFQKVDKICVNSFEELFKAVESNKVDYGVVPIENSSTGGISEVYDLLKKYDVFIVGEVSLKVQHNLLGVKDSLLDNIKEVYSHPQALEQSKEFLKKYPNIKLVSYKNTASSAHLISMKKDKTVAAIASINAAKMYNLQVLKKDIHHNQNNHTRFIVIKNKLDINEKANKISMLIDTNHEAGELFNILKYFANNKINMLKIESRPILNKSWEYSFYIDIEGNIQDHSVIKAIEAIKESGNYFKLIGNYISHCIKG